MNYPYNLVTKAQSAALLALELSGNRICAYVLHYTFRFSTLSYNFFKLYISFFLPVQVEEMHDGTMFWHGKLRYSSVHYASQDSKRLPDVFLSD